MKSILNENTQLQSSRTNQALISQSQEQKSLDQTNKKANSLQSNILFEKQQQIIETARKLFSNFEFQQSILAYKKALYLSEKVEVYNELAQVYIEVCDISMAIKVYQKALSMQKDEKTEEKLNKLLLYKGMNSLETGDFANVLKNYYEVAKLEKFKKKSEISEKIKLEEQEQERIRTQMEMEMNQKKKKKKKQSQDGKQKEQEEEERTKQEQIRNQEIEKLKAIKIKLVLPIHEKFYLQGKQTFWLLLLNLGLCFLSINYPVFAQSDIQKSLEFEPNFIDSLLLQAKIFKIQDKQNDANSIFWKVLETQITQKYQRFIILIVPNQKQKNLQRQQFLRLKIISNQQGKIYQKMMLAKQCFSSIKAQVDNYILILFKQKYIQHILIYCFFEDFQQEGQKIMKRHYAIWNWLIVIQKIKPKSSYY